MAFPLATEGRRLAHIRTLGQGQPGWGNTQRWSLPGQTPSVSAYDAPDLRGGINFRIEIGGNVTMHVDEHAPTNPTLTRHARYSYFNSVPASAFFNQLGGASGTGRNLSAPLTPTKGSMPHTPLYKRYPPGAAGQTGMMPAMTYSPFPPGGALWPKVI